MHSNRSLEIMRDGRDRYLIWKELSIFRIPVGYVKTTLCALLYFKGVVLSVTKYAGSQAFSQIDISRED